MNDGADNIYDNIYMPWPIWIKVGDEVEDPINVDSNYGLVPTITTLGQNYPNPFNPTTVIPISLASRSQVELVVMDITGRVVLNAFNGPLNSGNHTFEINGHDLPAGLYLYRLTTANFAETRKLLLLK
jgi:hypothetical protein